MNNPKLEFNIGEPVELKLLTDNVITGISQYGKWNMFPLLNEYEIQSFFAPQDVVDFIQKKRLGKNSVIAVTKDMRKKGKKLATVYDIEIISKNSAAAIAKNGSNKPDKRKTGIKIKPEFVQLREAIIGAVNELFQQMQVA
ncbi:MAG: hypothetical protein IT280_01295 [Ignavibacteria bacterium]|nr:hypothetical protein [Ignavibacteria bacterium]